MPKAVCLPLLLFAAVILTLPPGRALPGEPAGYRAVEAHDRRVYEAVGPAVVGITCRTSPTQGYFGTGVAVSGDGYILTSTTVVPKGATNIKVFFRGAMEKQAEIVGLDDATEAALIKVDAKGLRFVPLADSAKARPGEMAYTFGNPFGTLSSDDKVSFSSGFISGVYKLAENGDFQSKYRDLVIETEAAVNPGSDGGPLIDGQGRLLGIISLGYSERRWLGAVVPTHRIAARFEELKKKKPPDRHLVPPAAVLLREAAWQKAIAKVAPAVVQVFVGREEKVPPKREGLTYPQMRAEAAKRYKMRPAGPASGVLVSAGGHILTAHYHLTGKVNRNQIRVRLADGRELKAKMLGFDKSLDLVMLKVEIGRGEGQLAPDSFLHAELARGAKVEVGDCLTVLGRSEDLKTVTANRGMVSAVGRGRRGTVQTSAFINYGNSGGPAVDIAGNLVGVSGHVSHRSTRGLNSGIGFVTPAATIRKIYADLAAGKEVKPPRRTFLGVGPGRGKPTLLGAPVGRVLPGSAAKKAGIRPGDTITHVAGVRVESWSRLVRQITGRRAGEQVKFTVRRGNKTLEIQVTLGSSE